MEIIKNKAKDLLANHSHCVISVAVGFVLGAIIF
jgi:hypothetical protein